MWFSIVGLILSCHSKHEKHNVDKASFCLIKSRYNQWAACRSDHEAARVQLNKQREELIQRLGQSDGNTEDDTWRLCLAAFLS